MAANLLLKKVMGQSTYVPNSISMSPDELLLITGPNMSSKSTHGQLALCDLSANRMFVPAKIATIPVFARRAADDLISGQRATFIV